MKMKKTLAGLLASVVAISAMATSAVSAEETTKTYDLSETRWACNWAGDFEVNQTTALPATAGPVDADHITTAEITGGVATQSNDIITLTFSDDIAELTGKITYAEHVVGGNVNSEKETTKNVTFKKTAVATRWTIEVKTANQAVSEGEVYIPLNAVVRNIQFTAKTGEIVEPDYVTTKPTDKGDIWVASVAGTSTSGVVDARNAFNKLTDEIGVGGADRITLKGDAALKTIYNYDIVNCTVVTDLEDDNVGADRDILLPTNFRKYANSFFTDAVDGTITFEFSLVKPAAAATTTTGIQTPDLGTISLSSGDVKTTDIGLALNWNVTNNLVAAKNITDNKVTFSWDELTKYIADDGNGTVTDWAIKVNSDVADDYTHMYISKITYAKNAAAATVDSSTTDTTTDTTSNPGTGSSTAALALVPVALAAAAIVVSKKRS